MTELMVVVFMSYCHKFTYGEFGFSSTGSCSYSREWVKDLRTKLSCVASKK